MEIATFSMKLQTLYSSNFRLVLMSIQLHDQNYFLQQQKLISFSNIKASIRIMLLLEAGAHNGETDSTTLYLELRYLTSKTNISSCL